MLKKTANQSIKQSTDKLKSRIDKMVEGTDELIKATGMPVSEQMSTAPESVLNNLVQACDDHVFWMNFKKAAPMLFCAIMENNEQIKQVRDMSFMEELMKVKSLIKLMQAKLGKQEEIDIIEYSMATSMLESKLSVLKSLNTTVEGDGDEKMTLNIQGTNKAVVIDLVKFKDCITFLDKHVEEKDASHEDFMTKVEELDLESMTEDEFVDKVAELVGDIKKNDNKTLTKDSFIKIFKYTGDFAKMRSQKLKS